MDWRCLQERISVVCIGLLFSLIPFTTGSEAQAQQKADLILHNGKILTVDRSFSTAQAVAVSGRQFSAVGRNEDILKLAGPDTRVIDLKGRTVIPGVIETHAHIHEYSLETYGGHLPPEALQRYPIDWRGVSSKGDVLSQIQGTMDKYKFKPGQWVYFVNQSLSPAAVRILNEQLNRWELDKVAPNNPIVLNIEALEVGALLVNSKAIEIVWDTMGYGDFIKKYGRYWLDDAGRPSGHFEPPASRLFNNLVWDRPAEILAPPIKSYLEEWLAAGLTTSSTGMPPDSLKAFELLESKGELPLRFAYGIEWAFGTVKNPRTDLAKYTKLVGSGNDRLWLNSNGPANVDGGGQRGCSNLTKLTPVGLFSAGYYPKGKCLTDSEYRGFSSKAAPISANYYREWIHESGLQGVRFANTHTEGDRSVANLLNMVEEIQKQKGPAATKGWAIDHCTLVNPADIPRAAKLGIVFGCAPKFIEASPGVAKSYGEAAANNYIVPVKSMTNAGIKVAFEMDRDSYLWHDVELLVSRKLGGKVWGPNERIDRVTALKMMTTWSADYVLKPDKLGSIEPGKLADLVVLDRDFLTIPEEEISDIRPQLTLLDGKIAYLHSKFAQEYNLTANGALVSSPEELMKRRTSPMEMDNYMRNWASEGDLSPHGR